MSKRILLLGASGTIGRAVLKVLQRQGHAIVCFGRSVPNSATSANVQFRFGDVTSRQSIVDDGFRGQTFDLVVSCMASRTGVPDDAWAIDYRAHLEVLAVARQHGVRHFVLLSSICVQRPLLAFQQAKLAFEHALVTSGITYSIIRPTAYFKSLSGQVERVRSGKPFLIFGDGEATACKPISDTDLAEYIANCIDNILFHNRILPIGGPGEAITPREQGALLFAAFGQKPRFRHVPLWLFDAIGGALGLAGLVSAKAAQKCELAKIGRYYATESMLLLNPVTGCYDAAATPSTGKDHLAEHYSKLAGGEITSKLGDHAIF
jgi:divinyl chlorophyllide a 8-vinyl-reductase